MTTTSYAILGLLAIQSWTSYELVQQVALSTRRIWPRAQSKLYEEPKKLVALGFARAAEETVGKRKRTRYTITPKGRRALAAWVAEPGAGPELEFEQLLKIHFADSGTKADVLANLEAARAWAHEQNAESLQVGRAYLAGADPFPGRAPINQLVGGFLTQFYALVDDWAVWAGEVVTDWPDDVTQAELNLPELAATVRVAERIASGAPGMAS